MAGRKRGAERGEHHAPDGRVRTALPNYKPLSRFAEGESCSAGAGAATESRWNRARSGGGGVASTPRRPRDVRATAQAPQGRPAAHRARARRTGRPSAAGRNPAGRPAPRTGRETGGRHSPSRQQLPGWLHHRPGGLPCHRRGGISPAPRRTSCHQADTRGQRRGPSSRTTRRRSIRSPSGLPAGRPTRPGGRTAHPQGAKRIVLSESTRGLHPSFTDGASAD